MRYHSWVVLVAATAALSCSRAQGSASPATTPAAAPATDSSTRRVPFATMSVSAQQIGPSGPVTAARMDPPRIPPYELLSDSSFSLRVMVGADGRPKLETMQMHDGATVAQREASRNWLAEASWVLPQRDGKPIEAPFQIMGRSGARLGQGGSAVRGRSGVIEPSGRQITPEEYAMVTGQPRRLSTEEVRALAPRAARIASDLDTLYVRPGGRVNFAVAVRVAMLDSAGALLGFLSVFDSENTRSDVAEFNGASIEGKAEGVAVVRLRWPRLLWAGRSDAPPGVSFVVVSSASVTAAQMRRQQPRSGSGTSQCSLGGRGTECMYIEERRGIEDNALTTIRVMVLQRGLASTRGTRMMDTAAARQQMERYRVAQRAAEDRGRMYYGRAHPERGMIGFELSGLPADTVFVGDQVFLAPWRRDSALVVLLDHERTGSPVVGTVMIPSEIPDGVGSKTWESGDTTFIVRPREPLATWRTFFARFPAIAEFVR